MKTLVYPMVFYVKLLCKNYQKLLETIFNAKKIYLNLLEYSTRCTSSLINIKTIFDACT